MKILHISLAPLAALLIQAGSVAAAQTTIPAQPGASTNPPADRGMIKNPDARSGDTPSDPGIIAVPPKVDPQAVQTPPTNGEAKIKDATREIDRKNRQKTEDKMKSEKRSRKSEAPRQDR
jgi:hypothetical protein